jgi:hypothetical protein
MNSAAYAHEIKDYKNANVKLTIKKTQPVEAASNESVD